MERRGPMIRTTRGWYLDLAGGQHALLYSRPGEALSGSLNLLDGKALSGVGRSVQSPSAHALADWISEYEQSDATRSYLVSGGTEAFEFAIAIARFFQAQMGNMSRDRVVGLAHSYHGFSLAALSAGDHPIHGADTRLLDWPSIPREDFQSAESAEAALGALFASNRVSAVVIEPVGGTTSGGLDVSPAVHGAILRACREANVLLIADEVVTGFGRTGSTFCWPSDGFDVRIAGKLLGGGVVPICAVSLSPSFSEKLRALPDVPLRLTYAGNELAARASLTLQEARPENLEAQVARLGDVLRDRLSSRLAPMDVSVRGRGFLQAVSVPSTTPSESLKAAASFGLKNGVLLMGGTGVDQASFHIMVTPALDSKLDDLEQIVEGVATVVAGVPGH